MRSKLRLRSRLKRVRTLLLKKLPSQEDAQAVHIPPPVVESVKTWSEGQTNVECELIRPAETTTRQLPRTCEPSVDERFVGIAGLQYKIPEKYLARIPRARLVGEVGLLVLPDGSFASEVTFAAKHLVQQKAYLNPLPSNVRRMSGNYFSLLSLWAHLPNYYHWIHDAMMRLHLILPALPEDIRFIVAPNLRPFQYETLRLLGISPEQLCAFSGEEVWELESLYFAPPTTSSGSNSPAALAWFRELVRSGYGLAETSRHRRIYISRRLTTTRRIVNEPEVERVLRDWNFETYLLENLAFREQVELFGEAEAIVSTSGAGLTNMIFSPPGLKILVMVEPTQVSPYFWTMSEAAGHEYWYLMGETVPVPPPTYDADLLVPPEKLVRTLEAMLAPMPVGSLPS